jgi:hypothetical protein
MRAKPFGLMLVALGFAFSKSNAQNLPPDSLSYSYAANRVVDYYNTAIADHSEIYNGNEYDLYPQAKKGSFYFQDIKYTTRSLIRYNGTWYQDIPVIYDIYNDFMVAAQRENLFVLLPGKVSDVYLLNHHFIYKNAKNPDNLSPGFYDLVYNGKSQVLIKRTKITVENTVGSQTTEITYLDGADVYIKKANRFYLVNSRNAFLDVFKEKKKDLNHYLKENNINYKDDKEGAVTRLANYFDQTGY